LATEAQIRSIVADEVNKAVTTIQASTTANKDAVLAAVRSTELRLATDIDNHGLSAMGRDELLEKFAEVLAVVSVPDEDADYAPSFESLTALVDELHKHVCTRVDLH
jgi:hypothetical protein